MSSTFRVIAANSRLAKMSHGDEENKKAHPLLAVFYCGSNILVAASIVFANKLVFSYFNFKFVIALTWIHTIFTWVGMNILAMCGLYTPKKLPATKVIPLALGYIGYIVLCNVSLNINSVGFYQIMKIAISPTVVVMEYFMFGKLPSRLTIASVVVVCAGVTIGTVTDSVVVDNTMGVAVGLAATLVTALYQIWAGSKQRELSANSSQLLLAYTPHASWLLTILVPIFEPVGFNDIKNPATLIGFPYTPAAVAAIVLSALLGILVSLTTFLVIGATSSLTYNIVGHLKTVLILAGGVMFFEDSMPPKRLIGVCIAMGGIVWYTQLLLTQGTSAPAPPIKSMPISAQREASLRDALVLPRVNSGSNGNSSGKDGKEQP